MRLIITQRHGYSDRYGVHHKYGELFVCNEDLATKLLHHHIAIPAPTPEPETVEVAPQENTAKRVHKPAKPRREEEDRGAKKEASE